MAGSLLVKAQAQTDSTRHHSLVRETVRNFDRFDTNYIEPQHYIYTVMLQVTHNYDIFTRSRLSAISMSTLLRMEVM